MKSAPPAGFRARTLIRIGCLLALGIPAGFALYFLIVVKPDDQSYFPRCQFHSITGLHCPGCGLTRSLHSALNGNIEQAITYNILAPIFFPIVLISMLRSLWSWCWNRKLPAATKPRPLWMRYIPIALAALLIVFGILRNIPVEPFTLLAPHELAP